ncbi:uncharacterized protein TRIVIDRAFT_67483 [Trichoderma virens Gv29-8]|uniref:Copper-fist domain-containing protein n=1 Tax=Hypocrea virens (strain Gv29-8 / FGSC 10586) TaxID=413071 RepID=G9MPN0_HYPVG|nr:uncharacterized protein TRIVIDRAFT_67483 [Trichoderma virens Gv29-8]EHK23831.1 hypothetical protein TRIVIDRAFT_67483 [Trichoderma virens Gv29-8]UKZ50134.1 hypothetical protein TrVGV298_004390 [Trichoderma virens]
MPLINGQKMACEPCIRGHRSTKCTHASERLMVPVRKPGRPLSSCPHPSSQHCGCAAVTAAIPKKQKCRCGTSEKASGRKAGDQESQDTSNGLVTPPSPSPKGAATKPAYRVQKTGSKSASGRKPIDPADLERIDASQVNILSSPESKSPQSPNGAMPTIPTGHGMMGFLPNGTFIPGPAIFPSYQEVASGNPIIDHAAPELTASNGHTPPTNGQNASPAAGSCCGNGKSTAAQADGQQTAIPNGKPVVKSEPGSCCSSGAEKPEIKTHEHTPSQVNGLVMPPFNVPIGMPNGMFPYFVQPTIFAYPPQYGSYLQPLQPDQYRQLVTLNFPQQMANMQTMPYNAATPVQFPQPDDLEADSWTSHQCACGDSCQCIGCATHPYNQATQDYVRSAWNSMSEDTHKRHKHSDSVQSIPNGNYEEATPANQSPNGASTPVMAKVEGAVSPTLAQTPSDANSSLGEEPTLSANDFFFVSYPFGDSCEGEMASCPCGDSCQCIGCAIHNSSASADFDNVELGL